MHIQKMLACLGVEGHVLPVSGGDINQAYRVNTAEKTYFLKFHPGMKRDFFEAEVRGLQEIGQVVRVPEIYRFGEMSEGAYLLMEWIEPGEGNQEAFAQALAKLHQHTHSVFGYSEDNFIGLLPQINAETNSWCEFYLTCRLDVQVELAKLHNTWNPEREERFLRLKETLTREWQELEVIPSLLHGDFWRGNLFFDQAGEPVFVDPAVYYGDREVDIAMSQLFGGFLPDFLARYQELAPLNEGWEARMPVYQLYYLLVHLNQFGESYGEGVDRILAHY